MICIPFWGVLTRAERAHPIFHPGTHRENSSESAQFVICRAGIPSQSCWMIKPLSILYARHTRLLLAGGSAHSGRLCLWSTGGSWLQWLGGENQEKESPAGKGAEDSLLQEEEPGLVRQGWGRACEAPGHTTAPSSLGESAVGAVDGGLTVFGCWLSCSLGGLDKSHRRLGCLPPCLHSGTLARVSLRTAKDPGCAPCTGRALDGHHSPLHVQPQEVSPG